VVVGGDVPPGATHGTCPVELFGRESRLAQGLVQVARETGTPLVVFSEQLEGRERTLRIDAPIVVDDVAAAVRELAVRLEARLRSDPAAWHFWPQLEDYRAAAPDAAMPARSRA
jgi:lauroyl/myristoyl acyltransferase